MSVTLVSEALVYPTGNSVNPGGDAATTRDIITRLKTEGFHSVPANDASHHTELRFQTSPRKLKEGTRTADTTGSARSPWLKWNAAAMDVSGSEVAKNRSEPEFAVGLMSTNLSAAKRPIYWEIAVTRAEREWIGIGVANKDIELAESLRQKGLGGKSKRGRAWFYHDRGFLCDGEEFIDDSVAPFSWEDNSSCKLGVHLDPIKGELTFACNGESISGVITGVKGPNLVPAVYCNGRGTRFEVLQKPSTCKPGQVSSKSVSASKAHRGDSGDRSTDVSDRHQRRMSGLSERAVEKAVEAHVQQAAKANSQHNYSTTEIEENEKSDQSTQHHNQDGVTGQEHKYGNNPHPMEELSDQDDGDPRDVADKEVSPGTIPLNLPFHLPMADDTKKFKEAETSEEPPDPSEIVLSCGSSRRFVAQIGEERVEWLIKTLDQLRKEQDAGKKLCGVERSSVRNGHTTGDSDTPPSRPSAEGSKTVLESVLVEGIAAMRRKSRPTNQSYESEDELAVKGWRRWFTCFRAGRKVQRSQSLDSDDGDVSEIGL